MDSSLIFLAIAAYMTLLAILQLVISGAFFHEAVCSHSGKARVFSMFLGVCFLSLAFFSALGGFDYVRAYMEYVRAYMEYVR